MPHLRELVKLYGDQPFAIIGVNYNDDEDAFRKGLVDFEVSWISAYQGKTATISSLYRVEGYPTYFLLDTEGRIVATGHSSQALDGPLKKLMAELDEKGS